MNRITSAITTVHRRAKAGLLLGFSAFVLATALSTASPQSASAAACPAPSPNYGIVSGTSITVTNPGVYRIWSRMAAPNTTNNTYRLEVGGNECFTFGGSTVPVYASGSPTHFVNNNTNWISRTDSSANPVTLNLATGTHSLRLIGHAPNVVVDRVIFTRDTNCTPTGLGNNCASPTDTTAPTVSITSPSNGATISSATNVVANARDEFDTTVKEVRFYVDGTLRGTVTTGSNFNYTWSLNPTTLSLAAGSHTVHAVAVDNADNTATSNTVSFTVPAPADTTPPTISSISSGSISQTGATITWTTNEPADSQVEYGTTTSYGTSVPTTPSGTRTSHSISLTGLSPNTTYNYRVKSRDAAGNLATSSNRTFTTQPLSADTTGPTVNLTAPANGATVQGNVTFSATASDPTVAGQTTSGMAGVQFRLSGNNIGNEDTSSPYSISFNTATLTNGNYTLTARARDNAGNTTISSSRTITINNPTTFIDEDVNQDGIVNILDFSMLAAKFNQSANLGRADINRDGVVNILDFSRLAAKFGQGN